jgi:hypothetical protein
MAVQLVRPALRLLAGWATYMAASCCTCMMWRFVPLHVSVMMLEPCVWPTHQSGLDLSCEVETCRARRRLVVWGSSSGKLVGDATNWPKTRRLASVGLDQGPLSSLS